MSLYTFAAASLTTARDRSRHPAASTGQIARTLLLALALAGVALLLHRQGYAAGRPVATGETCAACQASASTPALSPCTSCLMSPEARRP